jgi:hypothetical protein
MASKLVGDTLSIFDIERKIEWYYVVLGKPSRLMILTAGPRFRERRGPSSFC